MSGSTRRADVDEIFSLVITVEKIRHQGRISWRAGAEIEVEKPIVVHVSEIRSHRRCCDTASWNLPALAVRGKVAPTRLRQSSSWRQTGRDGRRYRNPRTRLGSSTSVSRRRAWSRLPQTCHRRGCDRGSCPLHSSRRKGPGSRRHHNLPRRLL